MRNYRDKIILHSDMNSFYASVEIMLHPELKGKAVAVGGSSRDRHGIVLAKSELAKKAGVKTGMTNYSALRLCPELIIVPPDYDEYIKFSKAAREIYSGITDYVEPFGMDEAWLDVTDSGIFGDGHTIAEHIRHKIKTELGLTVSIGVSWNKVFAKLGSDMKKPDAITVIDRENFRRKVWPLPAGELIYAGRATVRKLNSIGIHTLGELASADETVIKRMLGINGIALRRSAAGEDDSRVMHKDHVIPPKSIGHGVTCTADLTHPPEVQLVMLRLSQDIGHRLREEHSKASAVSICIRSRDLMFREFHMQLLQPTRSPAQIAESAFELFMNNYTYDMEEELDVRQVTIRVSGLVADDTPLQTFIFRDQAYIDKRDRAETAVEELRSRFGRYSIYPASLMLEKKVPDDGRDLVRMPAPMYR